MTDIVVRPILSLEERTRRDELVEVVRRGARAFLDVGRALREIRDERLYRGTHETFEAFCGETFQLSRPHAYRLLGAAQAFDAIERVSPVGDITPDSERVLRPLAGLEPEVAVEAWRRAVELAAGGPVTHRHVAEAVEGTKTPAAEDPVPRFVAASERFVAALAGRALSSAEAEPLALALSSAEAAVRQARERHEVELPAGKRSVGLVRSARAREKAKAADPEALRTAKLVCVYCGGTAGPDGTVVHRDDCERPKPCVDCGRLPCACPEDEPAVEVTTGTYWRSRSARDHVLVVDSVEGDTVTVRYASDPRLPQKTTVAKVLEKLTLVARPTPKLRKALPRKSEAAQ